MKTVTQVMLMGILACAGAWGQAASTIRVGTSIEGARFFVDGQLYNTTQSFLWPAGSKHIVQYLFSVDGDTGLPLPYQYSESSTVRYSFSNWVTNGAQLIPSASPIQTVTASPTLTSLIATVTIEYRLHFQFYNTPGTDPVLACTSPGDAPQDGYRYGLVFFDGTCYATTTDIWATGAVHNINAFPYPGYVFTGWMVDGGRVDPNFLSTYTVSHSVQIIPQFMPAKRVRFSSNPPGLKIIVDSSTIQLPPGLPKDQLPQTNIDGTNCKPDYSRLPNGAPLGVLPLCIGDFDFLPGSPHKIGAPQSQNDDAGLSWVFSNFNNGLKNNDTFVPDQNVGTPFYITANFVPGIPTTFITVPKGLKLEVDGRQNWPNYSFIWGAGEQHHVTALATQTDSKGRKYNFLGWSNKGQQAQDVTVPNDRYGLTLTANHQILGQVQVVTDPPGLKITVDGADCTSPCTVDKLAGATMSVTVPQSIPASGLGRYDFDGWSTGGASTTLPLTFNSDVQIVHARYHNAFLLTAASDPSSQVTFTYSPTSTDGFFAEGTPVTITATAKPGYKFRRWDGDLTGTFATATLTMSSPRQIIARLDKVPFIAPAGVKNAAGETPDGTVAPGSIIAIYGENLSDSLAIGPTNPLSQTLADVVVMVNDRLLPLLFVSPQQINAQVPSDLPDGDYVIRVKNIGQTDVTGNFKIRQNSPGLYMQANDQNIPLALALHEDGSPVTLASPARRREMVSFYGTGFGPLTQKVIDGFIAPETPLDKLVDAVTVQAGDLTFTPQFAGAAPGLVGTVLMKLKIADEMPQASTLDLAVFVNGVQSNRVQLPVE